LAREGAARRVFGWFWNRTEPLFWSESGLLAGYPDPLLTLGMVLRSSSRFSSWMNFLFFPVLEGRGGGEVRRLLVMILKGSE
jgi:hypothetical protein